jgi:hypothetical protein
MKHAIAVCAALAIPLLSSSAHAAATDYGALHSLYSWQTVVDVWAAQTHGCGGDASKFTLRTNTANFEAMHSQLLASLLSGKRVKLSYSCEGNLAVVGGVQIGQ